MSLVEAILSFGGTDLGDLKAAVAACDPSEADDLVGLCGSSDVRHRVAATWVLKALLERDVAVGPDLEPPFARLGFETAWEPLLHLLQSVRFAPARAVVQRAAILRHLEHEKTLVRVWALDALVHVALASGTGLEDTRARVERALSADKASMRTRARHLAPLLGL